MSERAISESELEDQQQLAIRRLTYGFELQRREFFKLLGGGVLVCLCARPGLGQESGGTRRQSSSDELPKSIDAWLHLSEDGRVTVYTGKVEIGQNIRTSLSQQVAEELRVPLSSVSLVMADTDLTPFDMGTFGSRTTPIMGPQLRKVAASAREMLIDMAAERWHADRATLRAGDGKISDPRSNRALSYGELTKGKQLVKVIPDDPPLAPPAEWKIAGTQVAKVDGRAFVTGQHRYSSDMTRPGMLYGKVLRPTAFRATLTVLDTAEAEKNAGVTVVHDGNFVGVAAADEPTASRAVSALRAQWNAPQQPSEDGLFEYLKKKPAGGSDDGFRHAVGSVEKGLASADKTLAQTYTVAYIAHTPLEPRAALAEWSDGKLTVWTGTQRPFAVRDELAQTFHLPSERVRVIVPDTGSAYGGNIQGMPRWRRLASPKLRESR